MDYKEKLAWLSDRYEGMGIPYTVIAQYVHCDPSTLTKYVNGVTNPSKRMMHLLDIGLNELTRQFVEKMCNDDGRTTN